MRSDIGNLRNLAMLVGNAPPNGADGNPVLRRQTVHFPSGDMRVVERYTRVHLSR
jgi:hypothetical protein